MATAQVAGTCLRASAKKTGLLTAEYELASGRYQRKTVRVATERELHLDALGPPSAAEQQRVRSVQLRHEELKAPVGHLGEHSEQVEEIRLAGAVRPDQDVEGAWLEVFERADRLEAANGQAIESRHALPPEPRMGSSLPSVDGLEEASRFAQTGEQVRRVGLCVGKITQHDE